MNTIQSTGKKTLPLEVVDLNNRGAAPKSSYCYLMVDDDKTGARKRGPEMSILSSGERQISLHNNSYLTQFVNALLSMRYRGQKWTFFHPIILQEKRDIRLLFRVYLG